MRLKIAKQRENRKAWVKSLRSGKHDQCRGTLHRNENEYCCLGVASLIVGSDPEDPYGSIAAALGIPYDQDYSNSFWRFVDLNDTAKKSFSEIADLIEQHMDDSEWFVQENQS